MSRCVEEITPGVDELAHVDIEPTKAQPIVKNDNSVGASLIAGQPPSALRGPLGRHGPSLWTGLSGM